MKILKDFSITDVAGYQAAGIATGLKASGKKDMTLIYSDVPAVASATFTTNLYKAAPVLINMEKIKNPITRAVIINSGNANACTGDTGLKNGNKIIEWTAKHLNLSEDEILVQSTGVIGVQLDMKKMENSVKKVCEALSPEGGNDAASAIMTTDTREKFCAVEIELSGKKVKIAGIAKGSGMIHPDMATMLAFLVTDANISKEMLDIIFKGSVDDSYNMVSVDGDTSTNDMAMVMANGLANNNKIETENDDYERLKNAIYYVNEVLAKKIAEDGEGATKLIEVTVKNAKTREVAKICSKSVITSSLTKCAFFGADPNWGRIMCAIGYSGAQFDESKVDLTLKGKDYEVMIAKDGMGISYDYDLAKSILLEKEVKVIIDFKDGKESATAWGCDLSYDYVKINGEYTT